MTKNKQIENESKKLDNPQNDKQIENESKKLDNPQNDKQGKISKHKKILNMKGI